MANHNNEGSQTSTEEDSSNNYHQEEQRQQKYNYMCNECGEALRSLQEYIGHYNKYHPKSIATATT